MAMATAEFNQSTPVEIVSGSSGKLIRVKRWLMSSVNARFIKLQSAFAGEGPFTDITAPVLCGPENTIDLVFDRRYAFTTELSAGLWCVDPYVSIPTDRCWLQIWYDLVS